MNLIKRKFSRIARRLKLVIAAIFYKSAKLESTIKEVQKPPEIDLCGWGNPFDLFAKAKTWGKICDEDILALCRNESGHKESSEKDVVTFLYDLARSSNAKSIIEVGVYHGASSMALAKALADNDGGEIHLVDISPDYLNDVKNKIQSKNFPVSVTAHHVEDDESFQSFNLPQAHLVFVDANHNYEHVQKDIALYWPLVSQGGCMILHDTVKHDGTRKSAMELFAKGHPVCTFATSRGSGMTVLRKA